MSGTDALQPAAHPEPPPRRRTVPFYLVSGTAAVLGLGALMLTHATAHANHVALAQSPKSVTTVAARAAEYRASHRYVGTIRPWVEAHVGPQVTSAYVDTVLVRPGAVVKRGDVLATLDCRNASAESSQVAMQARALEAQQQAAAHEAARVSGLLDGGFVSANEAEQKTAETATKEAQLLAAKAQLMRTSLEVGDCVLRAPFDGEIAERLLDPGAFARPGAAVVTIVDRSTVRVAADVPEDDFDVVAPDTPVRLRALATGRSLSSKITRRAPAADGSTRTIHVEIDVPDPSRSLPVDTTADINIESGDPIPVSEIPLASASIRGTRATLFSVNGGVAHKFVAAVKGESGGSLYVERTLQPGTAVVLEGRTGLKEGDRVIATAEAEHETAPGNSATPGK